jgi:hypothetical protein
MEAIRSREPSVLTRVTSHKTTFFSHRRENLKSYIWKFLSCNEFSSFLRRFLLGSEMLLSTLTWQQ